MPKCMRPQRSRRNIVDLRSDLLRILQSKRILHHLTIRHSTDHYVAYASATKQVKAASTLR